MLDLMHAAAAGGGRSAADGGQDSDEAATCRYTAAAPVAIQVARKWIGTPLCDSGESAGALVVAGRANDPAHNRTFTRKPSKNHDLVVLPPTPHIESAA